MNTSPTLAAVALLLTVACDSTDNLSSGAPCVGSLSVDVAIDTTTAVSPTVGGFLVPLVVEATIPCLDGTAHATVIASAGQFSSAGTPPASDAGAATPPTPVDAGADGGDAAVDAAVASAAPATSAAPVPAGAMTTVTLTPAGGSSYRGFTTLAVSGAQLNARIQVTLGDDSSCELLTVSLEAGTSTPVTITDSGTCMP